jgi:hypothetical protein
MQKNLSVMAEVRGHAYSSRRAMRKLTPTMPRFV